MQIHRGVSCKVFQAVELDQAGEKWSQLFESFWPSYQKWFFSEGDDARPSYVAGLKQLRQYMPELESTYRSLCHLAGGSDSAARFLSMYCPPAYLSGCTQAVWTGDQPMLVRNYDYKLEDFEGVVLKTKWNDQTVIAMSDGMWGVLDGINESGLCVSLAFGGRVDVGRGFGIPIILRYILEFCRSTAEAIEVLKRVPTHMSYNITLIDSSQVFSTVYIAPDKSPVVRQVPVATNHQGKIEWARHAWATATLEREHAVQSILTNASETADGLLAGFLRPPVYNANYHRGFGTLYTAVYNAETLDAKYLWPDRQWHFNVHGFTEQRETIAFSNQKSKVFMPRMPTG